MKATFTIKDGITPLVSRMTNKLDSAGRKKVMEVIGMAMRNWAMEAFTDAGKRPAGWKAKRDGTPSTLQGAGTPVLRRSLRIEATASEVTVGSDRPYALIHQVGGTITAKAGGALRFQSGGKRFTVKKVTMPARPYLPVTASGAIMAGAAEDAMDAALHEICG